MRRQQHIITIQGLKGWAVAIDGCFYDTFRTRDQAVERSLLWARTAVQQEKNVKILAADTAGRLQAIWQNGRWLEGGSAGVALPNGPLGLKGSEPALL